MSLPDIRSWPDAKRDAVADRLKSVADFKLPSLSFWNYENCRKHRYGWDDTKNVNGIVVVERVTDRPAPGCNDCGVHFRKHQRVGIGWLYFRRTGLVADSVGTGKTVQAAGLIAAIREAGEMDRGQKVALVVRSPALMQWQTQLNRMLPSMCHAVATGTRRQRTEVYTGEWDTILIGPQMLLNDRDIFENFNLAALIYDDVDLRNRNNRISYTMTRLARTSPRVVGMTATPLQKRLSELYVALEPLDGPSVFGSPASFEYKFVRMETSTRYDPSIGRDRSTTRAVGVKNIEEFKSKLSPFVIRRTANDIDDVNLPVVQPVDTWLDLYPAQAAKYKELKTGVLRIINEQGETVKRAQAMAQFIYGAQICAGLAAIGEDDGPGTSIKMDWVMDKLVGDLSDEKVVIFCQFKSALRALQARMDAEGIEYGTIWGEDKSLASRQLTQERFWTSPNCRVLIGTSAIEQSLNLQISRHLINVDTILNPARMEQLAGRIRRDGSQWGSIYVHNLFTNNTQEAKYPAVLASEQSVINAVWNEQSELFAHLTSMQLLSLIAG